MRNILSAILIAFCLYNCSSDSDSPKTGDIYGVVTEKSSAEPMKATGVELYYAWYANDTGLLLAKTVTYDDGHYEFKELESGQYTLKVVAQNYKETTYEVYVEAGRTAQADMQLEKIETGLTVRVLSVSTGLSNDWFLLKGKVVYTKEAPQKVGFYVSKNSEMNNSTIIEGTIDDNGEFEGRINGLAKGVYYVKAYAKNSFGIEFSEFFIREIMGEPIVSTLVTSNITENTATLNGKIEYPGDPVYTEKGFVYSATFPNPTLDDSKDATTKVAVTGTSNEFSANIVLSTQGKYYVRTYAIHSNGVSYGNVVTFNNMSYIQVEKMFVQSSDIGSGDWFTAEKMCENSIVGGFSDWRMPTKDELAILCAKQSEIGNFVSNGRYWSSTKENGYVYYIGFKDGSINTCPYSYDRYVRCVRSAD